MIVWKKRYTNTYIKCIWTSIWCDIMHNRITH